MQLECLFLLLFMNLELWKAHSQKGGIGDLPFTPYYTLEDCAVQIKEIDQYHGYLAWAEIYLKDK